MLYERASKMFVSGRCRGAGVSVCDGGCVLAGVGRAAMLGVRVGSTVAGKVCWIGSEC